MSIRLPAPPRALALPACALTIVLLGGCGGSGDEPAPEPLTPVAYREAADSICREARDDAEAVAFPEELAEIPAFYREQLVIGRAQLAALGAIAPPVELAERHGRALAALGEQHALLSGALERLDAGEDSAGLEAELNPEITALEQETDALAGELGLEVCGRIELELGLAGGADDSAWREAALTATDEILFFNGQLASEPTLAEITDRNLGLRAEADRLIAALDLLADETPPPEAATRHRLLIEEVPPVAQLYRRLAVAVAEGDESGYREVQTRLQPLRPRIEQWPELLSG